MRPAWYGVQKAEVGGLRYHVSLMSTTETHWFQQLLCTHKLSTNCAAYFSFAVPIPWVHSFAAQQPPFFPEATSPPHPAHSSSLANLSSNL
jgi:hypothetical protein